MSGMAEYFGCMVGLLNPADRRNRSTSHDCYSIEDNCSRDSRDGCRSICNCITCCYFVLALILFTIGTAITVLTLNDHESYFISLGHMWVIGPIFICSGLMVAIKTIIYIRRQSMVALLTRQRDFRCPPEDLPSPRDPANFMLPPSYDSIAGECSQRPPSRNLLPTEYASRTPVPQHQEPPPCYEEALLGGAMVEAGQFAKGCYHPYTRHPMPKQSSHIRSEQSDPVQRAKGPQTL